MRDLAVWQARAGCYSRAALSSNDSKKLYKLLCNKRTSYVYQPTCVMIPPTHPHRRHRSHNTQRTVDVVAAPLIQKRQDREEGRGLWAPPCVHGLLLDLDNCSLQPTLVCRRRHCCCCCCCNVDLALRLSTAHITIDVSGTSTCAASPQPNVNVDLQLTWFGKFSGGGTRPAPP